ncbi:class I SAM-dependent methyltransferase [Mobilicoccus pelagius]|uniref:Methyltransferase domain-containing protein n=1 Tax=Mobilicoccus pelagius NBRC 104925 TaxID=1089455 RepID=H5UPB3_9MICO|nr:class I SAM-dependent methyltransferase [Mobilicoccus pelagius]GAB47571.1 hypothetical protein MOPEL_021_00060 [Mobilicoccus pelagius NBRC 104925]
MSADDGLLARTAASYDAVADRYVELFLEQGMADVRTQPWLRAALDAFATSVAGLGPVLDVGCGPGQVTAYLHERGLDASGIDLSPRMVTHARRLHPRCRYDVGSATDLRVESASLGGILGWWSLFNLPRAVLPAVVASFRDALAPGGRVLVATHAGEDDVHRTEAYGGIPVDWTTHRWTADALGAVMTDAGLLVEADLRLAPGEDHGPAVVLMARRP